jgi:hypothetical protein
MVIMKSSGYTQRRVSVGKRGLRILINENALHNSDALSAKIYGMVLKAVVRKSANTIEFRRMRRPTSFVRVMAACGAGASYISTEQRLFVFGTPIGQHSLFSVLIISSLS